MKGTSNKGLSLALISLILVFIFTQAALSHIKQRDQVLGEQDTRHEQKKTEVRYREEHKFQVPPAVVTPTPVTTRNTESGVSNVTPTPQTQTSAVEVTSTPDPTSTPTPTLTSTDDHSAESDAVIIRSGGTTTEVTRSDSGEIHRVNPPKKPEVKRAPLTVTEIKQVEQQTGLNLTTDDLKLFYENDGGKVVAKGEKTDGTKVDLNQVLEKINARLADSNIHIATSSAGDFVLSKASISAETKLPLSLNLATNSLIVTTPNGIKTVAVLPDKAVQNMLAHQKVNVIDDISLVDNNGAPAYHVTGETNKKFLGVVPVRIKTLTQVSAENGEVTATLMSPLSWLMDKLSR